VGLDLVSVHGKDVDKGEPTRFGHLASSRMALRYCLAPSAYKHPQKSGLVTVPGNMNDELAPGTLNSILKQAGLKS